MLWVALVTTLAAIPVHHPGDRAEIMADAHSPNKVARNSKDAHLYRPASFHESSSDPSVPTQQGNVTQAKNVTEATKIAADVATQRPDDPSAPAPEIAGVSQTRAKASITGEHCGPEDLRGTEGLDYVCDSAGPSGSEGYLYKNTEMGQAHQAQLPEQSGCHTFFGITKEVAQQAGIAACPLKPEDGQVKNTPVPCKPCKTFFDKNQGGENMKVLGAYFCKNPGAKAVECADAHIPDRSAAALVGLAVVIVTM